MYKVYVHKNGTTVRNAASCGMYKTLRGAKMAATRNLPSDKNGEYLARIYDLSDPYLDPAGAPEMWTPRPTDPCAAYKFNTGSTWTEVE